MVFENVIKVSGVANKKNGRAAIYLNTLFYLQFLVDLITRQDGMINSSQLDNNNNNASHLKSTSVT